MNLFQFLATIIHDLLVFTGAMAALLVVLLIWITRLPAENPLKRILHAVSLRVAAMAGAGAIAIPVEGIPGLDLAYDVAVPAALIYFWVTLFREIKAILQDRPRPAVAAAHIEYEQRPSTKDAEPDEDKRPPRLPR
jgi:hypothetical protein